MAAIGLGLRGVQKAVGNLPELQKDDGRARHRDVLEARQSNVGGAEYEEPSQQRGTKGGRYSYEDRKRASTETVRGAAGLGRRTSGGSIVLLMQLIERVVGGERRERLRLP